MVTFYLPIILLSFLFCIPASRNNSNEIVISYSSDPVTLDPLFATDLSSKELNKYIFKTLFKLTNKGIIEPLLVNDFKWDEKSHKLSFRLKKIKNHNNEFISPHDVVFSLRRLINENSPRKATALMMQNIKVTQDGQIELTVLSGLYKILILLSQPQSSIYSAKHFQEGKFISWGEFYLKTWNKNNFIALSSDNSDYPRDLLIRILPHPSAAIFLFSKNELDIMPLPFFLLSNKIVEKGKVISIHGNSVQYIAINKNECYDHNFRKALNYALDRDLIIKQLFDSYAENVYGVLPATFSDKKYSAYEYNPTKAVSFLKSSRCYPEITRKIIDFRMRGDDINQATGRTIAEYLKRIGLNVKLTFMEKIMIYKENAEKKGDLTLLSWYLDYKSPLGYIDPVFNSTRTGNGGNRSFYKNDKVDKFIELSSYNNTKQIENKIPEINQIIIEDAPWIFLWSIHENYLISKKVERFPALLKYIE